MFPRIWAWPSLEQRDHCMDVCDVNTKAKKGESFVEGAEWVLIKTPDHE